jgi:hypothetical protein
MACWAGGGIMWSSVAEAYAVLIGRSVNPIRAI